MKNIIPSFVEFTKFNNRYRELNSKPHQKKAVLAFYYPFAVVGLIILCTFFIWIVIIIACKKNESSYRSSDKYKKVIKEGVFL